MSNKIKYDNIEKEIIRINPMYKANIDDYHRLEQLDSISYLAKDYTDKADVILSMLYYKGLIVSYQRCVELDLMRFFDDIVSSTALTLSEYILVNDHIVNYNVYIEDAVDDAIAQYNNMMESTKNNIPFKRSLQEYVAKIFPRKRHK